MDFADLARRQRRPAWTVLDRSPSRRRLHPPIRLSCAASRRFDLPSLEGSRPCERGHTDQRRLEGRAQSLGGPERASVKAAEAARRGYRRLATRAPTPGDTSARGPCRAQTGGAARSEGVASEVRARPYAYATATALPTCE